MVPDGRAIDTLIEYLAADTAFGRSDHAALHTIEGPVFYGHLGMTVRRFISLDGFKAANFTIDAILPPLRAGRLHRYLFHQVVHIVGRNGFFFFLITDSASDKFYAGIFTVGLADGFYIFPVVPVGL
ncbi:MAG TPA: hypothetical protein GXZ76_00085 [Clostridiaceae bacterium]|nr:hypothetical protein [Clostridiaceae bacterium]